MSEALRSESGLIVETRGHVRVLTLDRPERRNALSSALQADLVEELLGCAPRLDVRDLYPASGGALMIGECDIPREDAQMLWFLGP